MTLSVNDMCFARGEARLPSALRPPSRRRRRQSSPVHSTVGIHHHRFNLGFGQRQAFAYNLPMAKRLKTHDLTGQKLVTLLAVYFASSYYYLLEREIKDKLLTRDKIRSDKHFPRFMKQYLKKEENLLYDENMQRLQHN